MLPATFDQTTTEQAFAAHVHGLIRDATGARRSSIGVRAELITLLKATHSVYDERDAGVIVRMRAWVLLALERVGVTPSEIASVLEQLETGSDPYLVAAAARALRSYPIPQPAFLPVIQRALATIRYSDEAVTLHQYSGYAFSASGITAARELRATLRWLKASATRRHTFRSTPKDRGDSDPSAGGSTRGEGPGDSPSPRVFTSMHAIGMAPSAVLGSFASAAAAFLPKGPMCWAAYLSAFGIAAFERIPYSPWLLPILIGFMIVNVASAWPGSRGDVMAFALSVAGAQMFLVLGVGCEVPIAAPIGVALSLVGSLLSVKSRVAQHRIVRVGSDAVAAQ